MSSLRGLLWPAATSFLLLQKIRSHRSFNSKDKREFIPYSEITVVGKDNNWILSYDGRTRCPTWVLETIKKNEILSHDLTIVNRKKATFYPEPIIRNSNISVHPKEYNHSGFNRGHMIPAADFRSSQESLNGTFTMANICPQNAALNQGFWSTFEAWIRSLLFSPDGFEEINIITGYI